MAYLLILPLICAQQIWSLVFGMAGKRKPDLPKTTERNLLKEALDALNAELRTKRNTPVSHRRLMEATIEAKARKRRSHEAPTSSAWKPQG